MRFLLTAEPFGAAEAHRIGLVQEVAPRDQLFDRALAIAEKIAAQAPLGVRATLASAAVGLHQGEKAAAKALPAQLAPILKSEDAKEGVQSFVERRAGRFTGK
jgi:enoyl-CoA hydratase/carnithine racemase